jgi:hypothetical protein
MHDGRIDGFGKLMLHNTSFEGRFAGNIPLSGTLAEAIMRELPIVSDVAFDRAMYLVERRSFFSG